MTMPSSSFSPSSNLSTADATDQRLMDLEVKVTYTEELVEQLDKIIAQQQQHISFLLGEVAELRRPVSDIALQHQNIARDGRPPHF